MSRLIKIAVRLGDVPSDAVSRVGGEPIGMTRQLWPRFRDRPMQHVLTLGAPFIVPPLPADIAAVAVFVSALDSNGAFLPDTKESKVVFLSKSDVARGTTGARDIFGAPLPDALGGAGTPVMEILTYELDDLREHDRETAETDLDADAISSAVGGYMAEHRCSKIGGLPVYGLSADHTAWCEGAEAPEGHRVLFDFAEALVPGLNCGDGFMYVTANHDCSDGRAWWQS